MVWQAPAVPEPWVVRKDDVTGRLSFWNEFYVEDGRQTGKLQEEVPTEFPPNINEYEARRAANGCWEHVHVETLEVVRDWVPGAPEGWRVDWSPAQQSWFWRNVATGEVTLDPPEQERVAQNSVESLVEQLLEVGLFPNGAYVTHDAVKKRYGRFLSGEPS